MSNYDELIKKAQKEIEKLTAGIEKSKARIAELRENIKELETKKANALQFSNNLVELMNIHGIESEEDRKAVLAKMEEYFELLAADKGEKRQQTETPEVVPEDEDELTTETSIPDFFRFCRSFHFSKNPYNPQEPFSELLRIFCFLVSEAISTFDRFLKIGKS